MNRTGSFRGLIISAIGHSTLYLRRPLSHEHTCSTASLLILLGEMSPVRGRCTVKAATLSVTQRCTANGNSDNPGVIQPGEIGPRTDHGRPNGCQLRECRRTAVQPHPEERTMISRLRKLFRRPPVAPVPSPVPWVDDLVWAVWSRRTTEATISPIWEPRLRVVSADDRLRAANGTPSGTFCPRGTLEQHEQLLRSTPPVADHMLRPYWPVCCEALATLINAEGAGHTLADIEAAAGPLNREDGVLELGARTPEVERGSAFELAEELLGLRPLEGEAVHLDGLPAHTTYDEQRRTNDNANASHWKPPWMSPSGVLTARSTDLGM